MSNCWLGWKAASVFILLFAGVATLRGLAVMQASSAPLQYAVWLPAGQIAGDGGGDPSPVLVAGSGGEILALWDRLSAAGGSDIVSARKVGVAWSVPLTVSTESWAWRPAAVADNAGGVHAVWSQSFAGETENIALGVWGGVAWAVERIEADGEAGVDPAIALDSLGQLHVAWVQQRGTSDTYVFWSKKGETTGWSAPLTVSTGLPASLAPRLATGPGGNVHLVWYSSATVTSDVYYARYDGSNWSAPLLLSAGGAGTAWQPVVGADAASGVHVVWEDASSSRLIYRRRSNDGTWSAGVAIAATADPRRPALLVLGPGDIRVVWEDWPVQSGEWWTVNAEIYYAQGDGATWSAPLNLSASASQSIRPALAADPTGRLYLVWVEVLGPTASAIYYRGQVPLSLPNKVFVPLALKGSGGN